MYVKYNVYWFYRLSAVSSFVLNIPNTVFTLDEMFPNYLISKGFKRRRCESSGIFNVLVIDRMLLFVVPWSCLGTERNILLQDSKNIK